MLVFASCSSDNQNVLSEGVMEDIIYDIHLSQGIAENGSYDNRAYVETKYRAAILKKYDITQAEWDSSFNYYCRHADVLHSIYNNVAERMREEVVNLGGEVSVVGEGFTADTTNIWNMERNFILIPNEPYNIHCFEIVTDSTVRKGDKLTLQFQSQFVFQDGIRDLVAVMAVTFMNDSVVSQVRHVTQQATTSIPIQDDEFLGIKKVSGYFMLSKSLNDVPSSTVRLASVSNVKIIIAHQEKKEEDRKTSTDSVNIATRDSVQGIRKDSVEASGKGPKTLIHSPL